MIFENNFSIRRIFHLFKKEFYELRRNILIIFSIFSGLLLISSFIQGVLIKFIFTGMPTTLHYDINFLFYLIFMGAIFASLSFRNMHNRNINQNYLMLPASLEEKFFLKFFSGVVIYPLLVIIMMVLIGLIVELGINKPLLGLDNNIFNPFRIEVGAMYILYLIIHSFFFQGSTTFRKVPFLFSALIIIGFLVLINITSTVSTVKLLDMETFQNFLIKLQNSSETGNGAINLPTFAILLEFINKLFKLMGPRGTFLNFFAKLIFPLIFILSNYVIAYFKHKEIQLHHSA